MKFPNVANPANSSLEITDLVVRQVGQPTMIEPQYCKLPS